MAKIIFTEEEVRAALPREHKFTEDGYEATGDAGTANAWEIFSNFPEAPAAAERINDTLVAVLTQPFEVDLSNLDDEVDGFNGRLSMVVNKSLRDGFNGENFGFNDTEPRYKMHMFVRRLFGTA